MFSDKLVESIRDVCIVISAIGFVGIISGVWLLVSVIMLLVGAFIAGFAGLGIVIRNIMAPGDDEYPG